DEETLFVVVRVDEPASDAVGAIAADFAGTWVKDIHTIDLHLNLAAFGREKVDVRLAKDDEEIAFAGVLEVLGHVQIGVHPSLEDPDASEFFELRGLRFVADAQAISTSKPESPASRAAATKSGRVTVPNSGPMKMAARFSMADPGSPSRYRPSAQTRSPGQGVSAVKVILSSLCACWTPAVLRSSRIICGKVSFSSGAVPACVSINSSFSSTPS